MKLYYTPRSHFSRKVRLLLDGWGATAELIDVGNVADATSFADNPMMKVPVLVDDSTVVFDSDHIAAHLTRRLDPDDRFGVLTQDVDALNARAVMNGVMAAEVEIILAQRTGLKTEGLPRFAKLERSMREGIGWLEANAAIIPLQPSYLGFHLVALWDHVQLYGVLGDLEAPALQERVQRLSAHAFIKASGPA